MQDGMSMCCVSHTLSLHNSKTGKHLPITDKKLSHLLNICINKNKCFYAAVVFSVTMSEKLI